jgi:phosphate:Na+ symporter
MMAGLGFFLFGMHLLEDSVKDLSGKAFQRQIGLPAFHAYKKINS